MQLRLNCQEKKELIKEAIELCEAIEFDFIALSKKNANNKPGKDIFHTFFQLVKQAIRDKTTFFESLKLSLRLTLPNQSNLTNPYWNKLKQTLEPVLTSYQKMQNGEEKFLYLIACMSRALYSYRIQRRLY